MGNMGKMALKLPYYFYLLMEKILVATSKFGQFTVRQHSTTRKHLYLYRHILVNGALSFN